MIRIAMETSYRYIARGGVTRYIVELMDALRRLDEPMDVHEVCCAIPNFAYAQPQRALVTAYREYIWTPIFAPLEVSRIRPEVFHMTCFPDIPVPKKLPTVATLHDLSQLRYPENYRPYTRLRWKGLFKKMRNASAVITVSEFTKREAIELIGIPADRIHAIPLAPTILARAGESAPLRSLPRRYFLFVGALAPNKNLSLLVKTYALAASRRVSLPPLVVVGSQIRGVSQVLSTPADWIFIDRVTDAQLLALYRAADSFIYPSVYEGFGLPVLEAMSAGCPVVCSPVASLGEAGGTAACFAELDPESYLAVLQKLQEDPAYRQERIERGLAHAATFSWEKTARQTVEVYREVIGQTLSKPQAC